MHKLFTNTTGKPMKHPVSGQTILPGQSYTEPEDMVHIEPTEEATSEVVVQTVADPKAYEKATARSKTKAAGNK